MKAVRFDLQPHSLAAQVCYQTLHKSIAVVPVKPAQSGEASLYLRLHKCVAFVAVELSRHVPYSAPMAPKSLLQHNPHLRNAKEYQRALRASVLSSIAIEGVKKAAERALSPAARKQATKAR